MQKVYDFLKECGTYFIATMDGDQPRVRAFGTIDLFEDKLYIQTGKKKDVARQLSINPKVEICTFRGGEWLRITCTLILDERLEPQKHMLEAYPQLAGMYQPGDGNNQVYYMKDATAVFYSFTTEPQAVTF